MTDLAEVADIHRELVEERETNAFLEEQLGELELALEDAGWVRLGLNSAQEFSRAGLNQIVTLSRLMYLKNPLIRRGVQVRMVYVFGQGFEINARDETVNETLKNFVDDEGNENALFSQQAAAARERELLTDGNVFFMLFPNRLTGQVKVRTVPVEEFTEIFTNPDDRSEPWFYRRQWTQQVISNGARATTSRDEWFPDWRYRPVANVGDRTPLMPRAATRARPSSLDGKPINWDMPVYHVKVGMTTQMAFGVPEVYPALDWARAHTRFLEDGATIFRSLAKFTWAMTAPKKTRTDAKARLATTLGTDNAGAPEHNPPPLPGSLWTGPEGTEFKPINKTGAAIGLDDGRHFRLQVAAALGIPDTWLSGDVDVGNHATAATMDRPTELAIIDRQELWADVFRDLCGYALEWSVRAARGALAGTVVRDQTGNDVVQIDGVDDDAIDVSFPPVLEHDIADTIAALISVATLNGNPYADVFDRRAWLTEVCSTLNVDNAEQVIAATLDAWDARDAEKAAQLATLNTPPAPGIPAEDGGASTSSTPPQNMPAQTPVTADVQI